MYRNDISNSIQTLEEGGIVHKNYFDFVRETISPFSELDAGKVLKNLWFVEEMVLRYGQSIDKDHLYLEGDTKLLLINQMKAVGKVLESRGR